MPTFVLIPGAGTDPRVYDATIEALRKLGSEAIAPPLPLRDQDATPSDHADAVAGAVPAGEDLVVVAQSLGAFSGPLVAARVPVAQLILLAPMIPRPGETAGEWWANTDDRLFPVSFQRRVSRDRLGLEIDEMAGGHLPMLSRPRELAARLVELAA